MWEVTLIDGIVMLAMCSSSNMMAEQQVLWHEEEEHLVLEQCKG